MNMLTKVARAIWNGLVRMRNYVTEAQMARAEWEVAQHLRMHGYSSLSEYQKEKLKYYERSNF